MHLMVHLVLVIQKMKLKKLHHIQLLYLHLQFSNQLHYQEHIKLNLQ